MTNNKTNNKTNDKTNDLEWLQRCSQLMCELAESPPDEKEPTDLAERVVYLYPDSKVCAEHEQDWRLVGQVIHDWGVDPVPFWFYDLFTKTTDRKSMIAEVQGIVAANVDNPPLHQFWSGLLALLRPGHQSSGAYHFWICLDAYGYSREPRYLEYWRLWLDDGTNAAPGRLGVHYCHVFDPACFDRWVVSPRCLPTLQIVLQELVRKGTLRLHSVGLLQRLFTVDWPEAWETVRRLIVETEGRARAFDELVVYKLPVPSHPAAFQWMCVELVRLGLPVNMPAAWKCWVRSSVICMAGAGHLQSLPLSDFPPGIDVFQLLLHCCSNAAKDEISAIITSKLREAFDANDEEHVLELQKHCWSLSTGAPNQRVCVLRANGLFMLPAVDSDLGALLFAQFIGVGGQMCENAGFTTFSFLRRLMFYTNNNELPGPIVDLEGRIKDVEKDAQSRVEQLIGMDWIRSARELRPTVHRLVQTELGGGGGVPCQPMGYRCVLRIGTDAFMEMLEEKEPEKEPEKPKEERKRKRKVD